MYKEIIRKFYSEKHQHRLIPNNTATRMGYVCLFYTSMVSMSIYCKYKAQCIEGTAKHC
jgi:hypothetical protein